MYNVAFNVPLNQAFVSGQPLPTFRYEGKERKGWKVEKIFPSLRYPGADKFLAKLESPEFYGEPEYRTFLLTKVKW